MHNTIKNYLNAEKARREESGESGFSLVELIIVVVILGVLAAIAIPVFLNIQAQAATNALDAVAGNAASETAAALAQDEPVDLANFQSTDIPSVAAVMGPRAAAADTEMTLDNFCVTATRTDGSTATSGPGC